MSEVSAAEVVMVAAPALGPGDDDPRSASRGTASSLCGPLGPGDDDPACRAHGEALPAAPPAKPGDGPASAFDMVATPAAGPGETAFVRRVTVIPKKQPAPVEPAAIDESSPRRSRRSTQGA